MEQEAELCPPLATVKEEHTDVARGIDEDEHQRHGDAEEVVLLVRADPEANGYADGEGDERLQNDGRDGSSKTRMDGFEPTGQRSCSAHRVEDTDGGIGAGDRRSQDGVDARDPNEYPGRAPQALCQQDDRILR